MESAKDKLKKELEEELKLNTDDLRSHAWYHARIPREQAESLVQRDGDFLIRDSVSSPGDYVLTCKWKHEPLHFKIIRVVLRPKKGYSRVLFQFEQDQFDSIPALVRFYVGNRCPISEQSGAIIFHPINRTVPLRLIEERYGAAYKEHADKDGHLLTMKRLDRCKRLSLSASPAEQIMESNLLRIKDKCGSQPANLNSLGRRPSLHSAQSDSNLQSGVRQSMRLAVADQFESPPSPVYRTGSEPSLSPHSPQQKPLEQSIGSALRGSDGQLHSKAPPKPLRVPSIIVMTPSAENEQQANTYCELVPRAPPVPATHVDRLRVEEKWKTRIRMTDTNFGVLDLDSTPSSLGVFQEESGDIVEEDEDSFVRPVIETTSSFKVSTFNSLLLSPDNKPLEQSALKHVKEIFAESSARNTALHILKLDCQAARIIDVSKDQRRKMGVASGLELITLPHGHQLRADLLERHHLIALGIAVDVLGCSGTVSERAAVLHKVIQLAIELKDWAGDFFAFSAIMKALEMPQISRLELTWRTLRRNHTDSAVSFEKNLKPFTKLLNSGKEPTALSTTTVPHLLPLIHLMEGKELWDHTEEGCELLFGILGLARSVAVNAGVYQVNAEAMLKDFQPRQELLEVFMSEFALRLFWGSRGAEADQEQRYRKFDQVLTVLSKKLEPELQTEL